MILVDHPMIQEIKVVNKNNLDMSTIPNSKEEYKFTRLLDIDLNITDDTINEKRMKRKIK